MACPVSSAAALIQRCRHAGQGRKSPVRRPRLAPAERGGACVVSDALRLWHGAANVGMSRNPPVWPERRFRGYPSPGYYSLPRLMAPARCRGRLFRAGDWAARQIPGGSRASFTRPFMDDRWNNPGCRRLDRVRSDGPDRGRFRGSDRGIDDCLAFRRCGAQPQDGGIVGVSL